MSEDRFGHRVGSSRVDFDRDGPRIGSMPLVTRGAFGFKPRSASELNRIFSGASSTAIDIDRLEAALASVALALNKGDLGWRPSSPAGSLGRPFHMRTHLEELPNGGLNKRLEKGR